MMDTPRYEKPAILAAIPRDRPAVIEASAGTGKTYTLEHLVVELLLQTDTRIEEVLVVTFTEKATAELKRRVREKLEELLAHEGTAAGVPDEQCWVLDAQARRRLQAALTALDSATLSTIHGFCQRVLAEQAFLNGRLFGEKQVDAREAFSAAFVEELRGRFAREPDLREMLRLWLSSGGTIASLEDLLFQCASERGRVEPSFDGPALLRLLRGCPLTGDCISRLQQELVAAKVHANTRDAVSNRLTEVATWWEARRERTDAVGLLVEFQELLEGLTYLAERLGAQAGPLAQQVGAWCRALLEQVPSFKAAVVQAMLPAVRERLRQRKRELGLLDFDDMLVLVHEALAGEQGEALARALRQRYRFALVDEFQDTDAVQWDIFRRVFLEGGGQSVLYVIGDPKQAIYSFRGADVQTYLKARRAVCEAGGAFVQLDTNFRSTRPMVEAVNHILDQQAASPFFVGDIRYDAPVKCGRTEDALLGPEGDPAAPVHLWHLVAAESLTAPAIKETLARRIAEEVRRLLDPQRPGLLLRTREGVRPLRAGDIYILTRGVEEGYALAPWLRAAGVPVAFFKQDGLFQSDEAHDIRTLLAAIADPEDRAARMRAWLGPFFSLSLEELVRARDLPGSHPLVARLLGWKGLADVRDYERLFSRILEESGVVRRELFLGGERRLTNYLHLFELLLEEVGRSRCSLPELVQSLQAYIEERRLPPGESGNVQRLESERDAVQVMTMHKSKGLEAPVVFLVGGLSRQQGRDTQLLHREGQRVLWVGPAYGETADLIRREVEEEDQRLLYVALTRAGARLYLPLVMELSDTESRALAEERGLPWEPPGPAARGKKKKERVGPTGGYSRLDGCYAVLNARLAAMRQAGEATPEAGFAHEYVWCAKAPPEEVPVAALAHWEPPAELLEEVPEDARVEALRRAHAGFLITSYSRLARVRSLTEDDAREDLQADRDADWPELPPDALPPGVTTGLFLHEVLERVVVGTVAQAASREEWAARGEVLALFGDAARRHGVEARHLPHAQELVWGALRTPLALPGGGALPGVAHAARLLREVEFLYPIPEEAHPLLGRAGEGRYSIERGCVRGFIDLVLEHEGRVYFADWKSDLLPRFDVPSITAHVKAHYALQEQLYTLAVVRMLGIRSEAEYEARFGGSLYLFLRGMREGEAGPEGVYGARVPWARVVAWEEALLRQQEWGFARAG